MRELGEDIALFADLFDAWKSTGAAGEFESGIFGKDGAYASPSVGGQRYLLRHVHLVPLSDPGALAAWERDWKTRSRKTSDRVLVYVSDDVHGHLLLFILEEPGAHAVALMKTPEHRELMENMAAVADAFCQAGIIAA